MMEFFLTGMCIHRGFASAITQQQIQYLLMVLNGTITLCRSEAAAHLFSVSGFNAAHSTVLYGKI